MDTARQEETKNLRQVQMRDVEQAEMNTLLKWFAGFRLIASQEPDKIIIGKDGWQANTRENPFWKDSETFHGGKSVVAAVEVLLHDGTTKVFKCPRCVSGSFDLVKAWRRVEK